MTTSPSVEIKQGTDDFQNVCINEHLTINSFEGRLYCSTYTTWATHLGWPTPKASTLMTTVAGRTYGCGIGVEAVRILPKLDLALHPLSKMRITITSDRGYHLVRVVPFTPRHVYGFGPLRPARYEVDVYYPGDPARTAAGPSRRRITVPVGCR